MNQRLSSRPSASRTRDHRIPLPAAACASGLRSLRYSHLAGWGMPARRWLRARWCRLRAPSFREARRGRGLARGGSRLTFAKRKTRRWLPLSGAAGQAGLRGGGAYGSRPSSGGLASGRPEKGRRGEGGRGRGGEGSRDSPPFPQGARRPWAMNRRRARAHAASPPGLSPHPSQSLPSAWFRRLSAIRSFPTTCASFNSTQCRPHVQVAEGSRQSCLPTYWGFHCFYFFYLQSEARGARSWEFELRLCHLALPGWTYNLTAPCFNFLPLKC